MISDLPIVTDPINLNDFALGAFIVLALRRGRINSIISRIFPDGD